MPCASEDGGQKLDELKMRLPVDEDDYLQPKLSKPNVYLELVNNESKAGNSNIAFVHILLGDTRRYMLSFNCEIIERIKQRNYLYSCIRVNKGII